MSRASLILCAVLLLTWGAGQAGIVSITGEKAFDVYVRDAERVEALTALFATARGARTLLLSDGISGRIDRLQLSQVSFDQALEGILGNDYTYDTEVKDGTVAYRISNPEVEPVVVAPPELAPELPASRRSVQSDLFSTTLTITSRGDGDGNLRSGGGVLTRTPRRAQPARRRTFGLHYTETIPFILMHEYFDPFGRIIRTPQVYYQTFGAGFDLNGSRVNSYLNTPGAGLPIPSGLGAGTIFGGRSITTKP